MCKNVCFGTTIGVLRGLTRRICVSFHGSPPVNVFLTLPHEPSWTLYKTPSKPILEVNKIIYVILDPFLDPFLTDPKIPSLFFDASATRELRAKRRMSFAASTHFRSR